MSPLWNSPPEWQRAPQCRGNAAGRRGLGMKAEEDERVSGGIVNSRNVLNIFSELRDVRQMPLLSGGPKQKAGPRHGREACGL